MHPSQPHDGLELKDRLSAGLANLARGAKRAATRAGDDWYPYYAGYSVDFAETVLRAASLPAGAVVVDPWNGSGTTTLAAAKLGLHGYGIDLNPFAVLVARARLVNKDDAKGVHGFARRVVSRSTPAPPCPSNDPLRAWLPKTLVAEFRAIAAQISANFATPAGQATQAPTDEGYSLIASFLLLALIRAARGLVATRTSSNPTNFRATARKTTFGISGLGPAWLAAVAAMGEQLQATTTGVDQMISLGDARLLATPRGADFVLTSPPYCTRLDYGDATRFEIAAMSPMEHENFDQLRRSLMGVPLVRGKAKPVVPKEWPDSLQTLLGAIRGHQSKASDSYYFKTYYQYFEDLYASLRRISSAMRANSSAAIVVQTSYYKEIPIALPDLFVDVALSLSLDAEVVHRMPVRTVLASIHPGTRRYRSNWKYEESVVLLRKGVAQ